MSMQKVRVWSIPTECGYVDTVSQVDLTNLSCVSREVVEIGLDPCFDLSGSCVDDGDS